MLTSALWLTAQFGLSPNIGQTAGVKIVVCVKQIPDPAVPGELNPETNTLKRDEKPIIDESDMYGVEMALQLAEATGGGTVSLVSMAPGNEAAGLRTALAMGAEDAVLVSDDALAGSDALSTAKVLAAAISTMDADLVLAGVESSDGYTGTVPEMIAGLMALPSITFAKHIEIEGDKVKVQRQTEAGYDDVECALPAVVAVTAGVVEPRYPSFKGIMSAKKKTVDEKTLADLGIAAGDVGAAGARLSTVNVTQAEERQAGEIITDEGEGHLNIVEKLAELKIV